MSSILSRPQASTAMDIALLGARLIVGTIFIAHGSRKLFGAFGGGGMDAVIQMMGPIGYAVMVGEFFGGIGMVIGLLTRFSAAAQIAIMIGAMVKVTFAHGFFGSFELNLALIGILWTILILGPGRIAIGRVLPLPRSRSRRPILILE